ncbi:acyltransferase family protein [Bradyrhizobium diazoefficiens]|uniref:acyltransferase family protein n=1 Tax=Bradyrhizobium diazoefficiens TaxID=1355477 RepID=UPI0016015B26|nr:acyltransferase [Bradyrhizobium diazoefficiens]
MKRFAYIDTLRGYAVLGVVLVHAGQSCGFDAAFGARGVQLFFVASALTLMTSWQERNDGTAAFFIRRAFRIIPMFWLSVPIYLGLNADDYTWQVIGAAAFLQFLRPDWIIAPIVPGGWSVCIEVIFYCTFPLVALYTTSFVRACILVVLSFCGAKLWGEFGRVLGAYLFPDQDIGVWLYLQYPNQMFAFAAGILCYFAIQKWRSMFGDAATETVLAGTLTWMGYLAAFGNPQILNSSLAFALLIICLANGAGKYLVNPALVYIGRFSFSIYLLHWLGIGYAAKLTIAAHLEGGQQFFVLFLTTVAITTALAAITYYVIELPMIRFGNRIIAARAISTAKLAASSSGI